MWLGNRGRWQPFRLPVGLPPCGGRSRRRGGHRASHVPMLSWWASLPPAETSIATWRLAGARAHLAAVAGIVYHEDLWQLCRDELTGGDVRTGGWDIRGRWFGAVRRSRRALSPPRSHHANAAARADQTEPSLDRSEDQRSQFQRLPKV